jgi:hypothetical protein
MEARELFQRLYKGYPGDPSYRRGLAWSQAYLGKGQIRSDRDTAFACLHEARKLFESLRNQQLANADDLFHLGFVYALCGDPDSALAALREAVERGYRNWTRLEQETAFDPFRARAEFTELVQRLRET